MGFKMIRNGSSWTNRSWCWMWLEQRSVEKHGQLRLDFTNFHELKPFLKYIKGHKLKINFTLVEKWKAPGYIQFVLKYSGSNFPRKKRLMPKSFRTQIHQHPKIVTKFKSPKSPSPIQGTHDLIIETYHCSIEKP